MRAAYLYNDMADIAVLTGDRGSTSAGPAVMTTPVGMHHTPHSEHAQHARREGSG